VKGRKKRGMKGMEERERGTEGWRGKERSHSLILALLYFHFELWE